MKKFINVILLSTLFTGSVMAESNLFVGSRPGGAGQFTFSALVPHLTTVGYASEIKFLGDCRKGLSAISNSNIGDLYWATNSYDDIPGCGITVTDKNFVDVLAKVSVSICYRSDKVGLGLDNFLNTNQRQSMAVANIWESFSTKLVNSLNHQNIVSVNVGNSASVVQTLLGNDYDYIMVYSNWAAQNLDKVTCFINSGDQSSASLVTGTRPMSDVLKNFDIKEFYDIWFIVTGNRDVPGKDIRSVRRLFREARSTEYFIENFKQPGLEIVDFNASEGLKFVLESKNNN